MRVRVAAVLSAFLLAACGSPASSGPAVTAPPATSSEVPAMAVPMRFDGDGDEVLRTDRPDELALASISHRGSGPFVVWTLDEDLDRVERVVDAVGPYAGTVALDLDQVEQSSGLEVLAQDAWTVTLVDVRTARAFIERVSGTGDDVLVYDGPPATLSASTAAAGRFFLASYTEAGYTMLVNAQGPVTDRATVIGQGPALVTVSAGGEWTLDTAPLG